MTTATIQAIKRLSRSAPTTEEQRAADRKQRAAEGRAWGGRYSGRQRRAAGRKPKSVAFRHTARHGMIGSRPRGWKEPAWLDTPKGLQPAPFKQQPSERPRFDLAGEFAFYDSENEDQLRYGAEEARYHAALRRMAGEEE